MNNFIIFISLLCFIACQSQSPKFNEEIKSQQCEYALENVPENDKTYTYLRTAQVNGGKLLSYSLTGVAYSAEILFDLTIGVVGGVILCSPTILANTQASAGNNPAGPAYCFPYQGQLPWSPPLGRKVRNATKSFECPNLDGLSQNIRSVAKCFADRGDNENRQRALKTMESIENSKDFYKCLSSNERNEFTKQKSDLISRIQQK